MDTVKSASELFTIVTTELTTLKGLPDLDPLQKARLVAQLCAVALQAIALCEAHVNSFNNFMSRQKGGW